MRTNYCGLVTAEYLDQTITLCGWVHRRRDHGGVIFIDLRDREGLVQVVCDPDRAEVFAIAESIRNEYVVSITGKVRRRPSGTENAALTSGQIEVLCHELEVLNVSATPPFQLDDENLSRPPDSRIASSTCAARRCRKHDAALQDRDGLPSLSGCKGLHRHRDADAHQEHARGRARLPGAVTVHPATSSPCRSRRNCSSNCSWWPATTATTRSPSVSAMKTCALTANPNSPRSISRPPSSERPRSRR